MGLGRSRDRSRARGGGTSLPWTPAALSPFAWYRADRGVTLNTTPDPDTVSTWADQALPAANVTQGTEANQPDFTAASASFANLPVLTCGATRQLAAATAADWKFLHDGTGMTLAVVYRSTDNAASQWVCGTLSGGGVTLGGSLLHLAGGVVAYRTGNGAAAVIDATSAAATAPINTAHVVVVTNRSGTNPDCVLRVDRVEATTASEAAAPSASDPAAAFRVSGRGDVVLNGLIGDAAEIVVWNRVLAAAEITAYESYVARWGI